MEDKKKEDEIYRITEKYNELVKRNAATKRILERQRRQFYYSIVYSLKETQFRVQMKEETNAALEEEQPSSQLTNKRKLIGNELTARWRAVLRLLLVPAGL